MNKTTRTITYITVIAVVSKLFGFVREMVIAAYYGATYQTDAFNMALTIIGLSTAILSMGVATVVVPMYNHRLVQSGKSVADHFASNILSITSLVYGILSCLGILFAPILVRLLAPSFDTQTAALTLQLLRILFIFSIATNAVNFLGALSRSNNRFLVPSLVGFPLTISMILFIVMFSHSIGIYAIVVGYIAAIVVQAVMIGISLRRVFRFKPRLDFTNGDVREIAVLSIPIFISIGVDQLNIVIDRMLASGLAEGSITAIVYSMKLRDLPHGIITASILTVIFPLFSQHAAKGEIERVKSLAVKSMSALFAVMAPVTVICVYYSVEIVKIVYERGAFTSEQTTMTAGILVYMIPGLFFLGGNGVLNNAFYGMQDTKTPRLGAVLGVGSNIVLNVILVRYMGASGLALATTLSFMLNYAVLLMFFRRKCGAFGGMAYARNIMKCVGGVTGMIPIFVLMELVRVRVPLLIHFAVSVSVSLAAYAMLLYVLRVELFMEAMERAKSFVKTRFDI